MNRALSSLRNRFFLALGVVLLLALTTLGVMTRLFVIPEMLAEEERYASLELDKAQRVIDSELAHLSLLTKDWATWDDSHAFLQGLMPGYLTSNLRDAMVFEDANLRLIAYFRPDGSPYRIAGLTPSDGAYTSCPADSGECAWSAPIVEVLRDQIDSGAASQANTWLLAKPEQALISLWPIVKSDGSGPVAGWLGMVRIMNSQWFKQLRNETGHNISVKVVKGSEANPRTMLARRSAQHMVATRSLKSLPSHYRLNMQMILPRQRFQNSMGAFRFTLYWTVGLLILVVMVVLMLLERMILTPLRQFAVFTRALRRHNLNASPPALLLKRRDEIGTLVRQFHRLLKHQQRQTSVLVELSQQDPLTGLANRRLFDSFLQTSLNRAQRERQSLALLMIDADHFKAYNDHYGHQAGDACLIALAKVMTQHFTLRQQLVARTGGEEFIVILPVAAPDEALQQAEALRQEIEQLAMPHTASPTASVVTVSIGVGVSAPDTPYTCECLLRISDSALYVAKQAGRNRVSHEHTEAVTCP
ncbi:diguanylate cyclase domain-containing protein [Halomonas sp. WWR20]